MQSIHGLATRFALSRRARNQRGVTMIEYALIAALIAVVMVAALTSLGTEIGATFDKIKSALAAAKV